MQVSAHLLRTVTVGASGWDTAISEGFLEAVTMTFKSEGLVGAKEVKRGEKNILAAGAACAEALQLKWRV